MGRSSQKGGREKIRKRERRNQDVRKTEQRPENGTTATQEHARNCLRNQANTKEWANFLGVSPDYIRMLIRGQRLVPEWMIREIPKGWTLFQEDRRAEEEWVRRMLIMNYGSTDRGEYKKVLREEIWNQTAYSSLKKR
jgi:hypothetical protein